MAVTTSTTDPKSIWERPASSPQAGEVTQELCRRLNQPGLMHGWTSTFGERIPRGIFIRSYAVQAIQVEIRRDLRNRSSPRLEPLIVALADLALFLAACATKS